MNTSNKRTPKLLSLLLVVCMVLSLLPMAALAAQTDIPIDEAHFPDELFRTYVLENCDTDKNAVLSAAEAAAVTKINLDKGPTLPPESQISSLQGIEFFTQLTMLNCNSNKLTSLDVSKNPNLTNLYCGWNLLTSLDLSMLSNLEDLTCGFNQLTSLDVSKNPNLTALGCHGNLLTSLDVSKNPILSGLGCSSNKLTSLDVSKNPNLTNLYCQWNLLTSLDLSKNPKLKILWCNENQLTSLDLSMLSKLESLDCNDNQLTSLDLSMLSNLDDLMCGGNQLTSLDLSKNPKLTYLVCSFNQLTSLDLSSNNKLNSWTFCGDNMFTVKQRKNITLPGKFDASKASNVVGGTFDPANNTFSFDAGVNEATYEYDTGYTGTSVFDAPIFKLVYDGPAEPETKPTEPETKPTEPETKPTEPKPTEPKPTEPTPTKPAPTEPHVHKFGDWVITKEPTSTTEGEETRTCSCGKQETRKIPKLSNPFKDISADEYYYEPVLWAVNKKITAGVSENDFGAALPCTRGQIATFLWAAAGKPEPTSTSNPFTDVSESDYYYKAVLWAVENGITSGMSADKFGPKVTCTRAQTVTFLWAAEGKPIVESAAAFTDVAESAYYYNAVRWAVENKVTAGVGDGMFGPSQDCLRGQIVTFLYKTFA